MILYLWVSEFRNIKNTGFNLSSKYDFTFDITKSGKESGLIEGTLSLKTNNPPIIFNNKINDIKVIVGENGAGKTSLIEIMLAGILNQKYNKPFIAISDNKKIYTKGKISLNKDGSLSDWNVVGLAGESIVGDENQKNTLVVKYSPIFNFDNLYNFPDGIKSSHSMYENSGYVDITNEGILGELEEDSKVEYDDEFLNKNPIVKYKHRETELFIRLFANENITNILSTFFGYSKSDLKVELKFDFKCTERILGELEKFDYTDFLEWEQSHKSLPDKIYIELLSFLIIRRLYVEDKKTNDIELVEKISKLDFEANPEDVSKSFLFKSELLNGSGREEKLLSFIKRKLDILNKYNKEDSFNMYLLIDSDRTDDLLELIPIFTEEGLNFSYFTISYPGFSSGEKTLLTFLSRLLTIVEYFKSSKSITVDEIILILDEPDITLHPEWQRVYISFLNDLLPNFFKGDFKLENTKYQIIITSHSPLMLSDLPNENILYLGKDERNNCEVKKIENKTFAANIHSLYANSFFLKGGKMAVGQRATEIIKDIIKQIESGDLNHPENVKLIVNSIGEPLIKIQLEKMLSKINTKVYVEDIQDPTERIKKLTELIEKAIKEEGNTR